MSQNKAKVVEVLIGKTIDMATVSEEHIHMTFAGVNGSLDIRVVGNKLIHTTWFEGKAGRLPS